jgi:hypothetical protein
MEDDFCSRETLSRREDTANKIRGYNFGGSSKMHLLHLSFDFAVPVVYRPKQFCVQGFVYGK